MAGVAGASVASAAVTWFGLLLAARLLGPSGYGEFMAVWSVLFAATGTLAGLQQEVTRRVATTGQRGGSIPVGGPGGASSHGSAHVWSGSVLAGLLGAALLVAASPWWGPRVWGAGWAGLLPLLALGFVGYAWANGVTGSLAGRGAWSWYAATILVEGLLRSVVVVGALLLTGSRIGWQVAILSGLLGWVVLAAASEQVRSTRLLVLGERRRFLADSARAVLAAGCSGVTIAGFPALLLATRQGESAAALGVVVAVVVNARAPLLLLGSFQGPVIRWLAGGSRLRAAPVVAGVVGTGLAVLVGWIAGPGLLLLVFGGGFVTSGAFVGGVVLGVALTAVVTLSGWWALVRGRHSVHVAGWAAVAVATVVCLLLPLPLGPRALAALLVPPLVGAAIHLLGARPAAVGSRRRRAQLPAGGGRG
ncbi:hypothetical protein SAMN04488570_0597 [Nocardioides scoriae]|uniref:Membrane protein involved in the export of O-antigen and teichoic acid n=2 Tax=Nocardioides scoriae TaxID=642780 RepID=A0A1H1MJ97_9ACTN|nr:hypothetical protein SAMN04488570_0597 [Nocardioides scoriae]